MRKKLFMCKKKIVIEKVLLTFSIRFNDLQSGCNSNKYFSEKFLHYIKKLYVILYSK